MHHIRLDVHGFSELCESIRKKEAILLVGADLKSEIDRIEIPAEAVAQMILKVDPRRSTRLASPAPSETTA